MTRSAHSARCGTLAALALTVLVLVLALTLAGGVQGAPDASNHDRTATLVSFRMPATLRSQTDPAVAPNGKATAAIAASLLDASTNCTNPSTRSQARQDCEKEWGGIGDQCNACQWGADHLCPTNNNCRPLDRCSEDCVQKYATAFRSACVMGCSYRCSGRCTWHTCP